MPKSRNNRKNKKSGNHSELVLRRKDRLNATYKALIENFNRVMNQPDASVVEEVATIEEPSQVIEPEIV